MENVAQIEESFRDKIIWVTSPKRDERIKIYVPTNGFAFWEVKYESGKKIPELDGHRFTNPNDAIEAVSFWLNKTKTSTKAKHNQIFGDKEPPVLKRKKVASRVKAVNG